MLKDYLTQCEKQITIDDFKRAAKIALITFIFLIAAHHMAEDVPKNYADFIFTNLILSFSITTPASLAGTFTVNTIKKELSLTTRSIINFIVPIISMVFGIFLGDIIIWLVGITYKPLVIVEAAFWPIFIFSCFVALVSMTYYTLKEKLQDAYEKIRIQERQKSELEVLKSKAELEALQAKINPHFLFNSLNSIAGLITIDPDRAESMTLKLSELFRSILKFSDDSYARISEELKHIETYLEIEKIRFGKRLTHTIHIEDNLLNKKIPQLIIQPIVENALKHGIEPLPDGGNISIHIYKKESLLYIEITDTGAGINGTLSFGYGLTNIQKRLNALYGSNYSFEIESEQGTKILLKFPID